MNTTVRGLTSSVYIIVRSRGCWLGHCEWEAECAEVWCTFNVGFLLSQPSVFEFGVLVIRRPLSTLLDFRLVDEVDRASRPLFYWFGPLDLWLWLLGLWLWLPELWL